MVDENQFSISDLLPIAGLAAAPSFNHIFPQDSIGENKIITAKMGDFVSFDGVDTSLGNQYTWNKTANEIPNSERTYFQSVLPVTPIQIVTLQDALKYSGTFYCEVHSLTLGGSVYRRKIRVIINGMAVLQPGTAMFDGNGQLINDPVKAFQQPVARFAATDGITKLLLVQPSNEPLVIRVDGNDGGSLGTLDGTQTNQHELSLSPVIIGSTGYVIAVYTVPDGYGIYPSGGRDASVLSFPVSNPSNIATTSVHLLTPPVVLVHGMWSDPRQAWQESGFQQFLQKKGFTVRDEQLADYSASSSQTFDPQSGESMAGRQEVLQKCLDVLTYYHNYLGCAVNQVDIVAHSLGGLMARGATLLPGFYNAQNNNQGYIHKLITLGTPHRGTPLGPLLYAHQTAAKLAGKKIGSVQRDFAPTSQAYINLGKQQNLHMHTIAGSYLPDNTTLKNELNLLTLVLAATSHASLFDNADNDAIVGVASQQGGLPAGNTSFFTNTAHTNTAKGQLSETNSPLVQQRVSDLLYSNNASLFSSSIQNNRSAFRGGLHPDTNHIPLDFGQATNKKITWVTPVSGAIINPFSDSILSLQVAVAGTTPAAGIAFMGDRDIVALNGTLSYTAAWNLPGNLPVGNIPLVALVRDQDGALLVDTIHITRKIPANATGFAVFPPSLQFDYYTFQKPVYLSANASNGTQLYNIDLSNSSSGTRYTLGKTTVASVSADGMVTALAAGTDTLEIKNGDFSQRIPVTVTTAPCRNLLQPTAVSGDLNPCIGVPVKYTVNTVNGYSYNWEIKGMGSLRADDEVVTVAWTKAGTYELQAIPVNACGSGVPFSVLVTVKALAIADTPTIQFNNGILSSSAAAGNQWFLNGASIAGAVDQTYKPTINGNYSVQVSNECGKSALSKAYAFAITAIVDITGASGIKVYPNPATDNVYIELPPTGLLRTFRLLDASGRLLRSFVSNSQHLQINVKGLSTGIYTLQIQDKKDILQKRLLIH